MDMTSEFRELTCKWEVAMLKAVWEVGPWAAGASLTLLCAFQFRAFGSGCAGQRY